MLRLPLRALIPAATLLALPSLALAQDFEPSEPSVEVSISIDIPNFPTDPTGFEGPGADFSFSAVTALFDLDVNVQLIPGDPIPDVDVTLVSKPGRPPPPPPPPPPDDEGGSCFFGVIIGC